MSTLPVPVKRQVLLASHGARLGPLARRTIQTLLHVLDGELTGVFVEDARLLTAARLPFTREVGRHSGVVRALECRDLERVFRLHAKAFRAELAGLAGEAKRPWHFEQRRGDVIVAALEALTAPGVAVLPARTERAALTRETTATGTQVTLLAPHESAQSLHTARALTQALGATLQVKFETPASEASGGTSDADRLRAEPAPARTTEIAHSARDAAVVLVCASLLPSDQTRRQAFLRDVHGLLILMAE